MAQKKANTIHIKLDYSEAVDARKALLSSELNLIKINKIMKRYQLLRTKELMIKEQTRRRLHEIRKHLTEIIQKLPDPVLPSLLKHGREKPIIESTFEREEYDTKLEKELKEIQRQLAALQE